MILSSKYVYNYLYMYDVEEKTYYCCVMLGACELPQTSTWHEEKDSVPEL